MYKKIIAGVVVVAAALGYVLYSSRTSAPAIATTQTSTASAATSASSTTSSAGTSSSSTGLKDGTYTGPQTDAVYGPMQVQAVISGGKLTSINILQRPTEPGHTTEVNDAAIPALVQEAITAQSAMVNIVSGATQTSDAFEQSLGSALQTAQA